MTNQELMNEMNKLIDKMRDVATSIDYFGGFASWAKCSQELMRFSYDIEDWTDEMYSDMEMKNNVEAAKVIKAIQKQVAGNHYKDMVIQPIEYIHKNGIGFCEGAAIKYLSRWKSKGGVEDLKKAIHMIELLIEMDDGEPVSMKEQPKKPVDYSEHSLTECDC